MKRFNFSSDKANTQYFAELHKCLEVWPFILHLTLLILFVIYLFIYLFILGGEGCNSNFWIGSTSPKALERGIVVVAMLFMALCRQGGSQNGSIAFRNGQLRLVLKVSLAPNIISMWKVASVHHEVSERELHYGKVESSNHVGVLFTQTIFNS